jgi:hypothetical protein
MLGAVVADGQKHNICREDAFRTRDGLDATLAIWTLADAFDIHGVKTRHAAILTAEVGCMDAIDALATLFVGRTQLENMGWLWPPWVEVWHVRSRFRVDLELMDACRTLANGGSVAVSAGITTTDDEDVLATRIDWVLYSITSDNAVLAREVIHGIVNSTELTSGDIKVTWAKGTDTDEDSIIVAEEVFAADIHADINVGLEENPLSFKDFETAIKHGTVHFEVRDSIAEEAANAVITLEYGHQVPGTVELLRCGKSSRSGAYDSDFFASTVCRRLREDPALLKGMVDDPLFNGLDGY